MKILIYSHRVGNKTINFIHNEINYLNNHYKVKLLYHIKSNENPFQVKDESKVLHYDHRLVNIVKKKLTKIGFPISSFANDFVMHVNNFKPDLIHIHFGNIAVRVLENIPIHDIPVFISFHGHDASRKLTDSKYRTQLNNLFTQKNVFPIFVSNYMLNNVKKFKIDIPRQNVLYYGIDLIHFKRTKTNEFKDLTTFLQISSFVEKKGHKYTLEAFKLFMTNYPNIHVKLILAGGGELLDDVKEYSTKLGLDDIVQFPGWVDADQARQLMDQSNVFIHHSVTSASNDQEGIPNAIMEAMAMELPILSTIHAGIPELVEHGVNGYLVDEKDVIQYSKRIKDVINWGYLSINRIKVQKKFEKGVHGKHLVEIYQKCIKEYNGNH